MAKMEKVMKEYKMGELHSGSKKGPKVTSRKQAIAIGMSEAREAGENVPPPKKKKKGNPGSGVNAKVGAAALAARGGY